MKVEENIGFLVFRAHKSLRKGFVTVLKKYGLTDRQYGVLYRLSLNEGISAIKLAQGLVSDSSTMVAVIDRLEQKGLVKREEDPADRRVNRLFLSSKARELLPHLVKSVLELEKERQKVLSQQEIKILRSALAKLYRFGQQWKEEA